MSGLPSNPTFADLVGFLIGLISLVIPFLFALILLIIVWRVIQAWVINGGNEMKVKEGTQTITVGVIVLVILSGIWGILELLRSSLFGL